MEPNIAAMIGDVLRRARQSRGLTLREVGRLSGGALKPTAVAGYERGERNVSVRRFLDLSRLYEIPPARLIGEIDRRIEGQKHVVIDLSAIERLGTTEGMLVSDFVHEVRALRHDGGEDVITLRIGDLEVLATSLGQRPEELKARITQALRQGP